MEEERKCILCGKKIPIGDVCEKCKKEYEIPSEKEEERKSLKQDEKEEIIAIAFSVLIPIVGFILGICFTVKNERKTLPIISIVVSFVMFLVWLAVFFAFAP